MPLKDIGYYVAADLRFQIDDELRRMRGDEPLGCRLVTDYHVVHGLHGGHELRARALAERVGAAVRV